MPSPILINDLKYHHMIFKFCMQQVNGKLSGIWFNLASIICFPAWKNILLMEVFPEVQANLFEVLFGHSFH